MIRIAVIVPEYLPIPSVKGGGVETLVTRLLDQNEIEKKYDFDVFSIDDLGARKKAKEYKLTKFLYNSFKSHFYDNILQRGARKLFHQSFVFNRRYFYPILKQISSDNYDYVLVENKSVLVPVLSKMLRGKNTKILLHIHNVDQINPNLRVNLERQCDGVIAVSNYVKSLVVQQYPRMLENRIFVVHNFSDLRTTSDKVDDLQKKEFYKKYDLKKTDKVVLYSGRVIDSKGILQLMRAISHLNNKNVHLLIIGNSWYSEAGKSDFEEKLEQIAKGLAGKVIFTGYVPHTQMGKYYAVADICVFPSIAPETAGLVQLEAMGFKKMTVISDSGGMPEYIGDAGVIVPLGNGFQQRLDASLENVLNMNRDELKRRGELLYQHSLWFSEKRAFAEFSKVISEMNSVKN